MEATFNISIDYSQIAVFEPDTEAPFNDWTDTHVNQGFAWRAESACFRTVSEGGQHHVIFRTSKYSQEIAGDAIRVIEVPFSIRGDGTLVVASIASEAMLRVAPATYSLRFEALSAGSDGVPRLRFTLMTPPNGKFRIMKADVDLRIPDQLLTSATPAV